MCFSQNGEREEDHHTQPNPPPTTTTADDSDDEDASTIADFHHRRTPTSFEPQSLVSISNIDEGLDRHRRTPMKGSGCDWNEDIFHRPFSSSSPQKQHEQNPSKGKDSSNTVTVTAEIFSKSSTGDEFKLELDSNDIVITEDLVERVLQHLGEDSDAARRFFSYVSDRESERLSKGSCYLMLGILRSNGSAKEHWDLFKVMREKRCTTVWGDWVEKRLRNLDVSYSSELVSMILRELGLLRKEEEAMMFFRWLQESNLFEHDGGTYNTMLSVLGKKGSKIIETFWRVADEMRGAGFGMSEELFSHVVSWLDDTIHTSWVIEFLKAMEEMKKKPSKRTDSNNSVTVTAEIFSKSSTRDEFKLELDSNDIGITQDLGERVLQQLGEYPDAARRFFGYVLERESKWLSKVSCLLMLGILRSYGSAKEFWDLFEVMRMKGYSVRSWEMYGLGSCDEVGYMNFGELYFCSSFDEMACSLVRQVIEGEWGDGPQKRLRGLDASYSSKLVSMILGKLREARWARYRILYSEMFFRWLQESNLFEHDGETYNAMLTVLGTQLDRDRGSLDAFWRVVDEMTGAGFEMSEKCYWDVCSALVSGGGGGI
ncbi:hypothetical protein RHGRI_028677 [Rhododendron griersonianum]|uniref:Pentatricopeptide repeat-containing protein n=1 Tax=Rhododendron griersonianum TaxID=479676 RepID=A0AAV6IGL9_9ERIC|nr:hypothetical protein RHGRI_028677 [Rhododendron griersonianum]